MKKIIFAILILAVTLTSCSLSAANEEQSGRSRELVKVSFSPERTRELSATYDGFTSVYLLTATPHFTRPEKRTVVGTVKQQEFTVDESGGFDAGYFERGEWEFTVEAALKTETGAYVVIASSETKTEMITKDTTEITFTLTDQFSGAGGDVEFAIKAPRLSEKGSNNYGVSLKVEVDGTAVSDLAVTIAADNESTEEDLLSFTGTLENLTAGCHNITFSYYLGETKISSENIEIRVVTGAGAKITGTLYNGAYVKGQLKVVYSTANWSMNLTQSSDETNYSVTCNLTGATTQTYNWYVDGMPETGITGKTYTIPKTSHGIYCVTCVVTVDDISKSVSTYVYGK